MESVVTKVVGKKKADALKKEEKGNWVGGHGTGSAGASAKETQTEFR